MFKKNNSKFYTSQKNFKSTNENFGEAVHWRQLATPPDRQYLEEVQDNNLKWWIWLALVVIWVMGPTEVI